MLADRMETVQAMLPLAAHHFQEHIEHVHQLRVGCRRAMAALRAFEPLFSAKPRRLKKWLRRIREGAGPARDADVLLARFQKNAPSDPVTEYAIARLKSQRCEAQEQLIKVAAKASRGQLIHCVDQTLRSLSHDSDSAELAFTEYARHALRLSNASFLQLVQVPDPTLAELHQLRIAGKRFRYSIEIFHEAFPDSLRKVIYPQLVDLQDRLGEINDHATAQALFQSWLAAMPADALAADVARRVAIEHDQAIELSTSFLKWWKKRGAEFEAALHEHCPSN